MKRRKPSNPMIAIQNAQLLAIEGRLTNTLDSFERRVRRWFSKEHCTPYLDTFKFPWDELLLHYYESNLANKSYNEVFDLAVEEFLPEFVKKEEDNIQEFVDSLVEQQKAEQKKKQKSKARNKPKTPKGQEEPFTELKKDSKEQSIKKDKKQAGKPTPKTMSLKFDDDDPDSL